MHGHHAFGRQQVVANSEDCFLDLAGIGRAADQHELAGEIEGDHRAAGAAMALRICLEAGKVDNGEFGEEVGQRRSRRQEQKILDEQRMPRQFGHNAHWQPMCKINSAVQVLDKKFAAFGVGHHRLKQGIEVVRRHRLVVAPPHLVCALCILHDEFVGRRTAGMPSGENNERTVLRDCAFAAQNRLFVEFRKRKIPKDLFQITKAMTVQSLSIRYGREFARTGTGAGACLNGPAGIYGHFLFR